MRKLILLIFIISLGFTSCINEKKCATRYPPKVITKDSTVTKIITQYVDTTVYIYLPADTIYQDSTIYVFKDVKTGLINSDTSKVSNEFATAMAWVERSELKQLLIQEEKKIDFLIDSAVRVTKESYESYHSEVIIKKEFEVHWYDKIARVIALIVLLALVIYIAYRIGKAYINPISFIK